MIQLVKIWEKLSWQRRITMIGALALTIGILSMVGATVTKPDYALLYAGLDNQTANEIISSLESQNIVYDLRGDAIYVPSGVRDRVRLNLAGSGLPSQGGPGYELLDGLNGFSTTSELFTATYWRAKEGELARTILSNRNIDKVRVHIAAPRETAFARNTPPPTASVTLTAKSSVKTAQAVSFRYLVALAVPDMRPENVTIIDSNRGIILAPGENNPQVTMSNTKADQERQLASDITRLLEARVGRNRARVQVSLDVNFEAASINERVIDPDSRVVVGRDTTETRDEATGASAGAVTVASNLPEDGTQAGGQDSSRSQIENREVLQYEFSETRRTIDKLPGEIERLSVAVLLDNSPDENGETLTAEELESLEALIATAAGVDPDRGDTVTVRALSFAGTEVAGTELEQNLLSTLLDRHLFSVIKLLVLFLSLLFVVLFIIKPMLKVDSNPLPALTDAAQSEAIPSAIEQADSPLEEIPMTPVERLTQITEQKTTESANMIKEWLEQPEGAA